MAITKVKEKYSPTRLQLIKVEFKMECLKDIVAAREEDIIDIENKIAAMQARLEGVKELNDSAREELGQLSVQHVRLSKEFEKEKEGTEQAAG